MKISFNKELSILGKEEKTSSKGNKYSIVKAFDDEGNYHALYCDYNLSLGVLKGMSRVDALIEITYNEKYNKIELKNYKLLVTE